MLRSDIFYQSATLESLCYKDAFARKTSRFSCFFPRLFVSLQRKERNEDVMEVIIDSKLYQQALTYAQQQGLNLTSVIENFLVRFVGSSKNTAEQAVPDVVLSLLGAGESVADEDLNAREAYYDY